MALILYFGRLDIGEVTSKDRQRDRQIMRDRERYRDRQTERERQREREQERGVNRAA